MVRESGWNTVKLKDICDFIGGGTPSKQVENFWCGNIPWISSSDLIESSIWKINITRHITAEAVAKSATHICPRNTVLVVSRVGVGKVAIAPFEVCTSQDFTNLVSKKHDARFLAYCIQNKMKIMAEKTQGTSIKGVTVENIAQMEIELPPQEEQTAIAEALSDIDNLISSMQKLIQKKKAIKQGATQELLTGKKRLPGFSGEWSYKSLGILGDLSREAINPQSLSETSFYEYSMPAYDNGRQPEKTSGKSMHSSRLKIYGDIILFNKLNVRQRRVWHVKECLENAVCSSEFLPYHSLGVHSEFLYQVLLCDKTTVDFENMSTGTSNSQKRITPSDFLEYEIAFPEKDEQEAIAQVLSDMDSEIEQLEKKLAKYQQIKQGMMQELLTGRIRLKEGENNA